MKTYKKASDILPDRLLRELQKYVSGETLYIPKAEEKKHWGEASGARSYYKRRNAEMRRSYAEGTGMDELCEKYGLSYDTVRRIVYTDDSRKQK